MTTALLHLSPSTRRFFLPERETDQGKPSGFTLVELLVAMCVSLLLLGGVVSLFGSLGESVNNSKSNSEMLQTMRHAARQLQSDLGNVSLVPDPAQTMVDPQGFFEYVEGPQNDANLKPEPVAELPDPIVMDNTGSNFDSAHAQGQIPWGIYTNNEEASQGYGGDAAWRECPLKIRGWGPEQASWTRSGLDAGMYKVWMTWPIHHKEWRRISGIPYSITAGDESTGGTIDQTALPSGEEYDGKNWQELAEIQLTAGEDLVIKLGAIDAQFGSSGGPLVLADAVRIQCQDCTEEGGSAATMNLVGDCDDVLHFTTKKDDGAYEVVWFLTLMTGTPQNADGTATEQTRYRLHRYERKFWPEASLAEEKGCSLALVKDERGAITSLNDAANRENRFAHEKRTESDGSMMDGYPGDPTLHQPDGFADCFRPVPSNKYKENLNSIEYYSDLEVRTPGFDPEEPVTEETNNPNKDYPRITQTVILENVIAFDVQAYDPDAPVYAKAFNESGEEVPITDPNAKHKISLTPTDPGYAAASAGTPIGMGTFRDLNPFKISPDSPLTLDRNGDGIINMGDLDDNGNGIWDDPNRPATYDSWSGDYVKTFDHDENSGTEEVPGDVGFDNDGNGIVDTAEDLREPPPYDAPLRAVQVEIRMQEPESGKVRSVKVRKFLGKR